MSNINWQTKKLGEIFLIERGGSPRPIQSFLTNANDGINWIKIGDTKNITKYIYTTEEKIKPEGLKKSRLVQEDDFILSNSMSFGRPYIMKTTGAIHDGWLVLRKKAKDIDNDFFYYLLLSPILFDEFDRLAAGSTVRNLNTKLVSGIFVSYPTFPEQRRIVKILDDVFEKTAKVKENAKKNLQNAKDLFESYLQSVFNNEKLKVKNEKWEKRTLGDIGKVSMCKRVFKEQTLTIGDIPFYKIGTFGKKPNAYISNEIYKEFRNKFSFPKKGDILLSASGTIGRRVRYDGEPAYFQDSNIVWIDNDEKQVLNEYLYYFYGACKWNATKGATIPRLYNDNLKQIKVAFPKSLSEQKSIVTKLDALSAETRKLETIYQQKLADLEELKKSVLKKAFAGEL